MADDQRLRRLRPPRASKANPTSIMLEDSGMTMLKVSNIATPFASTKEPSLAKSKWE